MCSLGETCGAGWLLSYGPEADRAVGPDQNWRLSLALVEFYVNGICMGHQAQRL